MIEQFSPVPDLIASAMYPVARQTIETLLNSLNIKHFFEERVAFESFAHMNTVASDEHKNPTFNENSMDVSVKFSQNPADLPWPSPINAISYQSAWDTPGISNRFNHLFADKQNHIRVSECIHPMFVSMDCYFNLESASDANTVLTQLRTLMDLGVASTDLDFAYPIPQNILGLLFILHSKVAKLPITTEVEREANRVAFREYLATNSNDMITRSENREDATVGVLTARRVYNDCLYGIDVESSQPDPIGGSSPTHYQVVANVGIQFSAPAFLGISYPIVVNNVLVEEELIPKYAINLKHEDMRTPFTDMDAYRQWALAPLKDFKVERRPFYDTWRCPDLGEFVPFMINLFTLEDIDNPAGVTQLDLTVGYGDLLPEVLEEIQLRGNSCLYRGGEIHLTVFKNYNQLDPEELELSEESVLTVRSRDIKSEYRLVIAFNMKEHTKQFNTGIVTPNPGIAKLVSQVTGKPTTVARGNNQRIWNTDVYVQNN